MHPKYRPSKDQANPDRFTNLDQTQKQFETQNLRTQKSPKPTCSQTHDTNFSATANKHPTNHTQHAIAMSPFPLKGTKYKQPLTVGFLLIFAFDSLNDTNTQKLLTFYSFQWSSNIEPRSHRHPIKPLCLTTLDPCNSRAKSLLLLV